MSEILQQKGKRYYNALRNTYSASDNVTVNKNCSSFQFTNIGDTICEVNGMRIYPGVPGVSLGDSRSISLHHLDVYRGNMEISFIQPLGVAPLVEIVQLIYLLDERS
jgi:hypothetical protein